MPWEDATVYREIILALVDYQGPRAHRHVSAGQKATNTIQETVEQW
jgi:hypothetical protein